MRLLARVILSIVVFLTFLLITHHSSLITREVYADGEFQTDYEVSYKVDENGHTEVLQTITLENKTANYYADKFELKIGSIKVENVKAQDEAGTPFCVTVDYDTLEDNSVTVRDRDSMKQERVKIADLQDYLAEKV